MPENNLKKIYTGFPTFISFLLLCLSGAMASETYDMDIFLNQPYPFAPIKVSAVSNHAVASVSATRHSTAWIPEVASGPQLSSNTAGEGDSGKIVSEIRVGALIHDEGPFSHQKESGLDSNLEVLFTSPGMLDIIGSPRPHIGATVNSHGDTSQGYLGLSWEWSFMGDAFAGFSLGGAAHNGATRTNALNKKELGCKVLFRESIDVGYRFFKRHAIMLHLAHISNAKLCGKNEGLENVGLRYGYKF